ASEQQRQRQAALRAQQWDKYVSDTVAAAIERAPQSLSDSLRWLDEAKAKVVESKGEMSTTLYIKRINQIDAAYPQARGAAMRKQVRDTIAAAAQRSGSDGGAALTSLVSLSGEIHGKARELDAAVAASLQSDLETAAQSLVAG